MRKFLFACILITLSHGIHAQQDTWDLRRCVEYAVANNISVKQADINARIAGLQTKLAIAARVPTLIFNTQGGFNFGRSVDPTTNQYTTSSVFFQSYTVSTGVTLYNWLSLKNSQKSAMISEQAAKTNVNALINNVSLNVANYYLQYLLSLEQENAAKVQISETTAQLNNTRKLVDAGSQPELSAAQLEAQLATDSSTYITDLGQADQNRLSLMGALSLDATTSFSVSLPDIEKIPLEPIGELQPAYVYNLALATQPLQLYDSLNIKAQEYMVKSTRGAMYPTISAFGQLGSNYASTYESFGAPHPTGKYDTVATVPVNGTNYYALTPGYTSAYSKPTYFNQIGNINFSQAFGVSLNIPIANGRLLRTNWERSKLNLDNLKLQRQQDNITLQSNIYLAYSTAVSALEKYNASTKAYEIDEYAFELAKKRYEIGVMSTIDYITTQNNMFTARSNQISAHYNYVFAMKILEFYKGQGVKL